MINFRTGRRASKRRYQFLRRILPRWLYYSPSQELVYAIEDGFKEGWKRGQEAAHQRKGYDGDEQSGT